MATIRKRGTKWQVQIRRVGHPPVSRSFNLKLDALKWAREAERDADRGLSCEGMGDLKRVTVADLFNRYLQEVTPKKRSSQSEGSVIRAFLRQPLCKTPLSCVTPSLFATYRDSRLEIVGGATVRREFVVLRHCFEVAKREWRMPLPVNPVAEIQLPPDSQARTRRLPDDELERLISALTTPSARYLKSVIILAVETGMRRGEILTIRWSDVDLCARTLSILKTKNSHPRTIPLTPSAVAFLSALARTDDRVVPTSPNAVRLAWQRLRERVGLDDLRLHDLRHEAVSRFFEYGLSVPEVALISGHRDTRMLARYTHLNPAAVACKLATAVRNPRS